MSINTTPCAFCDRLSFEKQIVTETKSFFVILGRRPLNKGHCIVLPKEHRPDPLGVMPEEAIEFVKLVEKIIKALAETFGSQGTNFFANFGKKSGQEVPHAHFHILPRYENETASPLAVAQDKHLRSQLARLAPDVMKEQVEMLNRHV